MMRFATALVGVASGVQGQVASFTFSDLLGSFDALSGVYSAVSGDNSSGDVTRLIPGVGTAEFDSGFANLMTDAAFDMTLNVSGITAMNASAAGSLTITDHNGDTLTAAIDGDFNAFGPAVAFTGDLMSVAFNDNSGDGTFDGTSSGSFSTSFGAMLEGSTVSLFFDPGNFFGSSFSGQSTQSSGIIIPAPASAALLGLGGVFAGRRSRG